MHFFKTSLIVKHSIHFVYILFGFFIILILFFKSKEPVQADGICAHVVDVSVVECEALVSISMANASNVALQAALHWSDAMGSGDILFVCNWQGVGCMGGHIDLLDISNFQLSNLPPEIGNVTHLTSFLATDNLLTTLPPQFWSLSGLTSVTLRNNQLSMLPASLGELTNLVSLDLSFNQLTSLPDEIGNLTHLTFLTLNNNVLTSLPSQVGNLTALGYITWSHNQLSLLPDEIGNLTNLVYVDISRNVLSALPVSVGNLTNVTTFYANNNQITYLATGTLSPLPLVSIDISHNYIDGNVLPQSENDYLNALYHGHDVWQDLQLATVSTMCNHVSDVSISECRALVDISIANSGSTVLQSTPYWSLPLGEHFINTVCDWDGVGCLSGHVYTLYLPNSDLTTVPSSIESLSYLTELGINNNMIDELPDELGNLLNLNHLYLNNNHFLDIPATLGRLVNLVGLYLSNNHLLRFPVGFFSGFLNLDLYASNNCLSRTTIGTVESSYLDLFASGWQNIQRICNDGFISTALSSDILAVGDSLVFTIDYTQQTGSIFTGFVDIFVGSGLVAATSHSGWEQITTGVYRYEIAPVESFYSTGRIVFTGVFGGGASAGVVYPYTIVLTTGYDNDHTNNISTGGFQWLSPLIPSPSGGGGGGGRSFIVPSLATGNSSIFQTTGALHAATGNTIIPSMISTLINAKNVYTRAYENRITTLPFQKARLYNTSQRYEVAKMLVQFTENVLGKTIAHNPQCDISLYQDVKLFDPETMNNVSKICDLGLMGWQGTSGKLLPSFRPFATLSTEELNTIVDRYRQKNTSLIKNNRRLDVMNFLYQASK